MVDMPKHSQLDVFPFLGSSTVFEPVGSERFAISFLYKVSCRADRVICLVHVLEFVWCSKRKLLEWELHVQLYSLGN